MSYASRALRKLAFRRGQLKVASVGMRAAPKLEGMGRVVETSLPVPASVAGIVPAVEDVLRAIDKWHFEEGVNLVVLFYARPASGAWYRIHGKRLSPADEEWINSLRARAWPSRAIPMFIMDEAQLFRTLIHEYLFVSLFRAFAESMPSENASRLASMRSRSEISRTACRALSAESR